MVNKHRPPPKTDMLSGSMNDRTFMALASANLSETPLASLDYEQQLFALTPQHLLFHPSPQASVQLVELKNITRIHSDPSGTLRIETGPQTAITASLIGYDPGRVQRFFQQVRDTTARIKQTPAPPIIPATPVSSVFGKVSAAPSEVTSNLTAATPTLRPMPAEPISRTVITPITPLSAVPMAAPAPQVSGPAMTQRPSSPTTPEIAAPEAAAPKAAAPEVVTPGPAAPVAVPTPSSTLEVTLAQAALLRRARSVGRLAGVSRLLALVLAAGSLGMGYVMWTRSGGQAQQLTALWTVTMGLVTAIALLILAEIIRFLSALGHVSAEQG